MTQNYVFMTENDIHLLHNFQNYTGRQCSPIFPSQASFSGLGWIWSKIFIYIKKLLFVRTIANIENEFVYKELLRSRAQFGSPMHFGI